MVVAPRHYSERHGKDQSAKTIKTGGRVLNIIGHDAVRSSGAPVLPDGQVKT